MANNRNIVMGSGKIYVDVGPGEGERYMAETPGFSLAVKAETMDVMSDDTPTQEVIDTVSKSVTRDFTLSTKNITDDSLALFLMGEAGTLSTTAGSVVDGPVNAGAGVTQGRYYQLGVSAGLPAGVRAITGVSLHAGATTFDLGADYSVDLALARIYIVPGGGIADGEVLTCDYATTAATWGQVASTGQAAKVGSLRYIADNSLGANRDLFIPLCQITPNGEIAWKGRDKPQEMGFTVKVKTPANGGATVLINGRPA
ncbi:MAG: hypothetical protein Q8O33_04470 [Pseudomonadota bacterium]|nr:hypothetical protein [Pseudomonadota bacterium]